MDFDETSSSAGEWLRDPSGYSDFVRV